MHDDGEAARSLAIDRALVDAMNDGDGAAFERLYERHRDWMFAVALRLTADRELAADVVQDAVLHWLGRFPGFVLTGPTRAYLYPVVQHRAIDLVRRRHRAGPAIEFEEPAADAPAIPTDVKDLESAVARLPLGQREVLHLHFGDSLTLAEVSVALSIPLGTVKSRLGLALAALRANDLLRRRYFEP
jgi:RNA polymerase sigma-70 factor (ECF subfamily)